MDKEGMTQEECSNRMGVARTTVTSIYDSARKKIAEAFIMKNHNGRSSMHM